MNASGTLEISTTVGCPIRCRYCPQQTLLRRYGAHDRPHELDFASFKGFVEKVPLRVKIHFSGMAEPWLNPRCTEMLLFAAGRGHGVSVYSTLVGMTEADFERIRDVRFDFFVTHLPDAERNSPIPISAEYLALLARVLDADLNVASARHASCHGTPAPAVAALLKGRILVNNHLLDRAGNLSEGASVSGRLQGPIACGRSGRRIDRNVLLPDGTVVLCCMDYGLQHVLGNLGESSYDELLGGAPAARIRAAMDDDSLPLLCRRCTVAAPFG